LRGPTAQLDRDGLLLEERYAVERVIARGGMGIVHRGVDVATGAAVAIKFLAERFADEPQIVRRFLREAQAAASLEHPHIVRVYAFGEDAGRPYLVMEHLEGSTIADRLRESGRLPLDEAAAIAAQVCDGLAHIHARGYVHRDIKSQNIFLETGGRAVLLDFGIVRVSGGASTRTVLLAGTPEYMSPEQAIDPTSVDARSDLYSLGVTFFEMLTGRVPFKSRSPFKVLLAHQSKPPPRATELAPHLPQQVDAFLARVLAKDPRARWGDAGSFRAAVETLAQAKSGEAPRRRLGRNFGWAMSVGALGLIAIVGSGWPVAEDVSERTRRGAVSSTSPQTRALAPVPMTRHAPVPAERGTASQEPSLLAAILTRATRRTELDLPPRQTNRASPRRSKRTRARRSFRPSDRPSTPLARSHRSARSAEPPAREAFAPRTAERPSKRASQPGTDGPQSRGESAARAQPLARAPEDLRPAQLHVVALHEGRGTWARIFVDTTLVAEAHAAYRTLPMGSYLVRVRREGFREATRRVNLGAGEQRRVVFDLEKE
jgi:serine/threonine protein kinase